jgi:hypothetical protein
MATMFTTTKFHKFELHMEQLNLLDTDITPVQRKASVQAQLDMWSEKTVTEHYIHLPLLNCSVTQWDQKRNCRAAVSIK